MASTVPGVTRDPALAKVAIGVPTPDISSLAAPTVPLAPVTPGRRTAPLRPLDAGRLDRAGSALPANGGGFAAALAKAIAARKATNDRQASRATTRQTRVEAEPRENAVRDVVRQLKQLVSAVREALAPKRTNATSSTPGSTANRQHGPDNPQADVAALNGVFARLVGMNADRDGKSGEDLSLSPQQEADVAALLQTVADSLAHATGADGVVDEDSLAAALALDPLALAAAESLVAAAQAQGLIAMPVVPTALELAGDTVVGDSVAQPGPKGAIGVVPPSTSVEGDAGPVATTSAALAAETPILAVSAIVAPAASEGTVTLVASAPDGLVEAVDQAPVLLKGDAVLSAAADSAADAASGSVLSAVSTAAPSEHVVDAAAVLAEAVAVVAAVEAGGGQEAVLGVSQGARDSDSDSATAANQPVSAAPLHVVSETIDPSASRSIAPVADA
ncbi:MAG TPA: hypothetical protein VFX49_22880, partial [Chloroflexota bacterium]|nr:hypothetical protein [Chloroflexota bacterium]